MIRLLHLADVHLDAPLRAFGAAASGRREQLLQAFRRLPDRAEEEDVHAVLVAGDLFDGPQPSTEAFAAVREAFRRLVEAGRPVFLVPGNHDAITLQPNPWRRDLAGAHLFLEPEFGEPIRADTPGGPLHVSGVAYDPSRQPEPLSSYRRDGEEGAQVVLLHGAVPDAPHWEISTDSLRLPVEALAALGADYLALGDYHRFRPPEEFAPEVPPACYPGSFAAQRFDEVGPRGFVVVELVRGGRPRVRHLSSGVPEVVDLGEVDVSRCETPEAAADAIAHRAPDGTLPVATLVGTPGFPLEPDDVREHLRERFPAFRLADETRHYASARLDELAGEETIVGHVVRLGRERIEAAEVEGAESAIERERLALRAALRALGVR